MAKTKTNIHICSNCFGEFLPKEIFISECVHNSTYSTIYCLDCTVKLKIKEKNMTPYVKTRKKKEVVVIAEKPIKSTKSKVAKKV